MKHTSEEIKYRLSDLGVQIGNIAIEYITELEKENAELKEGLALGSTWNKHLNSLNKAHEEERDKYRNMVFNKDEQLTKATEHIRTLISCLIDWVQEGDKDYCYIADAEQFLKECK